MRDIILLSRIRTALVFPTEITLKVSPSITSIVIDTLSGVPPLLITKLQTFRLSTLITWFEKDSKSRTGLLDEAATIVVNSLLSSKLSTAPRLSGPITENKAQI